MLTKKGFVSIMKHFALEKMSEKQNWFVIDFCQLGFIGKMFKSVELPWLVQFFLMFYNDKPGKFPCVSNSADPILSGLAPGEPHPDEGVQARPGP